ncbi:AsmA family protein [Citrobacter amalonaticus]|uniref:AsmA family protein n=1 Tax=Citrobacter TaxID=544 RepID=UPI0005C596A1|nr:MULTISPECIES: AsmA family protein [Citrobacter]EKW5095648.1 AsmA family protein [Citrobacter amalonaticus]MBJ9075834.1 AsmA family protein [Citrobacter amalonaticus]MBJ9080416.1 AsmA family protein [Citrobacter amalonaticus]MBJ9317534.1 AsmA family protein [Citrobacter amalonaticus]MBW0870157.1 AsmA family protein [Citrobacter amalonaticus]
MKFIGKLILYVLIALLVVILGLYFLLQTRWGAEHISAWISEHSDYQLSFEAMDHRFSSPSHILLKNVTFGRDGQPATLVAKAVDIGLSTRQLTHPRHVDTILLQNGTLNISPQTAPLPFQSDRLQLQDMALNSPGSEWDLSAQRVNGGIIPWLPEAGKVLGSKAQIQLSAGSLTLNDVPAANVLIEGSIDNEQVTLSTIGADIARGALTGVAKRHADGSWMVENLRLNDIRLQSDKSLADFFAPLNAIPSLQINRLEVTDARLQGPDWAVTDLDLSLRNLTFSKDDWQTQEGKLSMNASEFIFGSLHLFDPILNAEFSPQGIALRQFTTRWEGGMVRTSGNWLREGKALILDDAAIAGIEYTLPENWKQRWMQPLPTWLNSLTLKKFTASRNLVIDIDPTFPWQLTALDGYGANLGLVQNQKWGVWSGNATLNAAAATFNRVDVRRPSLSLAANANTVNISELSAFAERGILEATASVSQLPPRQTQISLNGRGVPVNVLQQWGWPALPIVGDGNIQLTASGTVQADAPLKPTVNGQLHAVNANKQQVTQTMQAGVVSAGEVTSTEPAPVSPAPVTP